MCEFKYKNLEIGDFYCKLPHLKQWLTKGKGESGVLSVETPQKKKKANDMYRRLFQAATTKNPLSSALSLRQRFSTFFYSTYTLLSLSLSLSLLHIYIYIYVREFMEGLLLVHFFLWFWMQILKMRRKWKLQILPPSTPLPLFTPML